MSQTHLLTGIVVLFSTAVVVSWMFRTLRAPSVMGFLFTGILIGRSGIGLIEHEQVEVLAELGLILLLFIVGLELSPRTLLRTGRALLVATAVQFLGTTAVAAAAIAVFGKVALLPALILGIGVALSSTAIVLKQLSDRGETRSAVGLLITGILLLQDVLVILVMILLPLFDRSSGATWSAAVLRTGTGLASLAIAAGLTYKALPFVLDRLIRPGGREFLALFAVLMACAGAWLAGLLGWSMALGSCIAGLLLSNADVRHQLVADITPFRDVFNALFFMSLGMLVDAGVVAGYLPVLIAAVLAALVVKTVIAAAGVKLAGWPLRPALVVGTGLCTVSEFGYVLGHEAEKMGLLNGDTLEAFIAFAVGTMMLGTLLFPLGDRLGALAVRALRLDEREKELPSGDEEAEVPKDHLIVVGFGTSGQNLVRALQAVQLPHCVVEMNPRLIQAARAARALVVVGDASLGAVMHHAGLGHARGLVVAINDARATERIIAQAKELRPDLYVLARANFLNDIDALYDIGASDVIPEDFEASIEMVAHALKRFGYDDGVVERQIAALRAGRYRMLRGQPSERVEQEDLMKVLSAAITATVFLTDDTSACGQNLAALNLRAETGATVIAVVRQGDAMTNPAPDFCLQSGDTLVLLGTREQLQGARGLLARSVNVVR